MSELITVDSPTGNVAAFLRSYVNIGASLMDRNREGEPRDADEMARIQAGEKVNFRPDPEFGWLPAALLATHGHEWVGSTLPKRFSRGIPKHCFHNSWEKVRRSKHLIYCEGYACSSTIPIGMEHAWIVDGHTGNVIEPTWDLTDGDTRYYLGLAIPREVATEALRRSRRSSISVLFGDWARQGWFGKHGADAAIAYTNQLANIA